MIAQEKQDIEEDMKILRDEKDREIAKLRAEIDSVEMPERGIVQELKMIDQLRE